MTLTNGQIGDLITALNDAVLWRESCVRADKPHGQRRKWNPAVRDLLEEDERTAAIYRKLRRKLMQHEKEQLCSLKLKMPSTK